MDPFLFGYVKSRYLKIHGYSGTLRHLGRKPLFAMLNGPDIEEQDYHWRTGNTVFCPNYMGTHVLRGA